MPRLYLTPQELIESPLGTAPLVAQYIATATPGALEKLLARVSQRCDTFCRRRIQAPGTTTVRNAASAGATTIDVSGTLTLDNLAENALQIGSGGTQEIVGIVSGGVSVLSWLSPFPGTLTLSTPLVYAHQPGEPIQYLYQDISILNHSSSEDPFSEAFTQEAQLAQIHAPVLAKGIDLTRIIFLKNYPVSSATAILNMEYTYSYDTTYYPIQPLSLVVTPASGFCRFRVGTVLLPNGNIRTTYIGGYAAVPDDVKSACEYYLQDEIVKAYNPFGLVAQTLGKRAQTYRSGNAGSPNVQEAETLLKKYRRNM